MTSIDQPRPDATATYDQLNTAFAGRYCVERELGRGGMATVYLAADLKHGRDVAIKVLHPELGAALGGERFLSEIRTTARLQHPHILPLLDSGDVAGLLYYVMPYVAGETLRTRLERERQLPIDDILRIARETADALGAAHALGIVHRDIKPENILLQGGHALVADFGIALAVQQAGGARMTQTGLSLGTPQYMSPEQAMGERVIDARSDIYSLGAVTYEMLVGEAPFTGATVQAILAKAMTERPTPPSTVRDTVPPAMERAVLRALAKLPADRFSSATDFASALASQTSTEPSFVRRASWRGRLRDPLVLGLAATLVLAVAALVFMPRQSVGSDPFPVRTELSFPLQYPTGAAALSPDGHTLVFVGRSSPSSTSGTALYVRRLDQLTIRLIPGSDNARHPAFSPDGSSLAFIAGRRKIMRLPLEGGAPVTLGDVADFGGIDWSPSGDIIVGAGVLEGGQGLFRVNAAGGALRPLTRVDTTRKELSHQFPRALADGKTVLFTIWYGTADQAQLAATSLDDGKVTALGVVGAKALGVVDGQLVYMRADGVAMAAPFDVRNRRVTGVPTVVQDSIRPELGRNAGDATAAVSNTGGLVYAQGTAPKRLVWVDRLGVTQPVAGEPREITFARLSPDDRRVALTVAAGLRTDLWMLDIASTTISRLTTNGTVRNPVWAPDGKRVLYASTQGGRAAFWWQAADGSSSAGKAGDPPHNPWNIDLAPDGRTVAYNALWDGTFNIATLALDSTHTTTVLAGSPTATEANSRFAPDGHSVAYSSDESGRSEIFVRPFPDDGARVQVSVNGGARAVWSRDGRHIYFWQGNRMMEATVARDPSLRVLSRDSLFTGSYEQDFDVAKDGRFLMIQSEPSAVTIVAIPNWLTELRRLTGGTKTR
jgi:eukaryotic-like serine/threonine-protein kinase